MASEVIMPKMGYDMTEGVLTRWLKRPGDHVRRGEPIAEVETDKVTLEIESFVDGTVETLLAKDGDRVPVGTPIATIDTTAPVPDKTSPRPIGAGEGGEALPTAECAGAGTAVVKGMKPGACPPLGPPGPEPSRIQAGGPMPESMAVTPPTPLPAAGASERVKASPLARRLAAEKHVDLSRLRGSGPGGRIVRADVEGSVTPPQPAVARPPEVPPTPPLAPEAAPTPPPAAPAAPAARPAHAGTAVPGISRSQQAVARIMALSKQTIPHFYLTLPVTMDEALVLRTEMNEVLPAESAIGVNDLVIKAVALALAETPELCRRWTDTGVETVTGIHVALAVALPDGGIISPVLHDAAATPLPLLARRSRKLIQDARNARLSADAVQGAVFTVSSLGSAGIESFAAIITPPQSGVLSVASIQPEPVVRDSDIDIEQRMRVTLSADHRLIGGVAAAAFLHRVRDRLESPYRLLIDVMEEGG